MSQPSGGGPGAVCPDQGRPHVAEEPRRARSLLREMVIVVVTAMVLSLLVKTFLVQAFFVPSGSMEPTLHGCTGCVGDRVLVDKVTPRFSGIHRGDVVVFRDSEGWLAPQPSPTDLPGRLHEALAFIGLAASDSESDLVKRVIGVGGDTVEGRGGTVYVNGTALVEPYVLPGNSPSSTDFRVTVPAGKLWVMGDHRDGSADSRAHRQGPGHGFVSAGDVVGRAFVIVWPLGREATLARPATFDRIPAPRAANITVR